MRTKTWAYATGASFGGVAGAYYASAQGRRIPSDFYFNLSVFILCMVILGGIGSVWGVIARRALPVLLRPGGPREDRCQRGLGPIQDVPKYNSGIFGLILVLVMLLRPTGLIPERRHKREEAGRARHAVLRRQLEGADTDRDPPMTDLLTASGIRKEFGGLIAVNDVDFTIPQGVDRQPDRPERRRKDDVLQHAHGRLQADRGRSSSTGPTSPASRRTRSRAGSAARSRTSASSSR